MMVAFALWGGCGPTAGDYCEDQMACAGGNEEDQDACVEMVDLSDEYADIEGCGDEWDDLFDCFFDNATCQTQQTGQSCGSGSDCMQAGEICQGGECVRKTLALESSEYCRQERDIYNSCSGVEFDIF